jgi:hypothetical protein
MTPTFRVSNLAAYARWKDTDGDDLNWLYQSIYGTEQTPAMERGTAFHAALEIAKTGEFPTVSAMGYTFAFTCDAQVVLPRTREIRMGKDYGGIIVSGKCDGVSGRVIDDHKTTSQFDAEHHLEGWQHNFYMDIFDADEFRWHCWEMRLIKDEYRTSEEPEFRDPPPLKETIPYEVYAYHLLKQYRYPEMERDCRGLAQEFLEFVTRLGWPQPAL